VTKRINRQRLTSGAAVWQRSYWEHIIRTENELNSIREYIIYNPAKWEKDNENPNILGDHRREEGRTAVRPYRWQ